VGVGLTRSQAYGSGINPRPWHDILPVGRNTAGCTACRGGRHGINPVLRRLVNTLAAIIEQPNLQKSSHRSRETPDRENFPSVPVRPRHTHQQAEPAEPMMVELPDSDLSGRGSISCSGWIGCSAWAGSILRTRRGMGEARAVTSAVRWHDEISRQSGFYLSLRNTSQAGAHQSGNQPLR